MLGDTAKSLTAGPEVTIALSAGGSGEGIIGFEGSAPGGTRRTTTRLLDGEFPKVRSLFPTEHLTKALVDKLALIESVKRVALVAERNTAVQLAFSDGVLTLDAGSGDEAQASESIEATIEGEDLTTGFNPQFLLDGLTAIDEAVVELAFTQASKPVVISGSIGEDGEDPGVPLPAHAAPPAVLTSAPVPREGEPDGHSDSSASARWAATCGPVSATPATPSSATTTTPTSPTSNSLAELVEELPSPKVVWVMVPAGGPTHEVITELGDLLGEGDLVVDGGNSRWTDDQAHGEMLAEKGIGFVDCGVSGGVWGLKNGYALMYGGSSRRHREGPAGLRRPQARG